MAQHDYLTIMVAQQYPKNNSSCEYWGMLLIDIPEYIHAEAYSIFKSSLACPPFLCQAKVERIFS